MVTMHLQISMVGISHLSSPVRSQRWKTIASEGWTEKFECYIWFSKVIYIIYISLSILSIVIYIVICYSVKLSIQASVQFHCRLWLCVIS